MELLIFLLSPIINAWWDAKHGETHHFRSWIIRGIGIVAIAMVLSFLFNPWPELITSAWWLYAIIGFSIEFLLFDYLYNWFTGNNWKYIGEEKYHKDDFTWKLYDKAGPYIILFIKAFLFITALSLYYQLDLL